MRLIYSTLILCLFVAFHAHGRSGREGKIMNDAFRYTVDGEPIYSQGGGIFRYPSPVTGDTLYYWYGVRYAEARQYLASPSVTYPRCTFEAVTCYSSNNLVDWTYEGDVLTRDEVDRYGRVHWVGRMGVAYIEEWRKYALVTQHDNGVLFALSDTPTGRFEWHHRITMDSIIGTPNTGDQTVFVDPDTHKPYLVYSYGRGRNRIYISEIGVKAGRVDLLDCTRVFKGAGREGNCMFKYGGRYYMCASNLYGWDSSFAYYLVADDIRGPYTPENDMQVMPGCADDYAHVTQTGFFCTLRTSAGRELVLYCGDRWAEFAGNGHGYNQWFPLSFSDATPYFNSLHSWYLDVSTAEWRVARDNNYVRNGSFEADRRPIPCPKKPVQDYILGWNTEVLRGNIVRVDDADSPILNFENSEQDRLRVVGEKSLYINDDVDFERRVSQQITSTPYVSLPDGIYTMTARIKNSQFEQLEMYAESDGRRATLRIEKENTDWTDVTLKRVRVRDGKVEIGFYARGRAGAWACIDDVSFHRR